MTLLLRWVIDSCWPSARSSLMLALAISVPGCGLFSESSSFIIRVDNVTVVGEPIAGGELTIRFQGVVGGDGCSRLVRVQKNVQALKAEFGFEGERLSGFNDCTAMPVLLDHEEVVPTPIAGTFQIRVRQPDKTFLTQSVQVQ